MLEQSQKAIERWLPSAMGAIAERENQHLVALRERLAEQCTHNRTLLAENKQLRINEAAAREKFERVWATIPPLERQWFNFGEELRVAVLGKREEGGGGAT